PSGKKWGFVRANASPRYLAVNGDEGEPGTFKDRFCIEHHPDRFLEGLLIAAWVLKADAVYLYLRDEYPWCRDLLTHRLASARLHELCARTGVIVHLRRGAGAYICGEETALLESLEGKRGLPRHKPPFPAQKGLFGRPTVINNVETLFWIPEILAGGGAAFAGQGVNGAKGLRLYSVSGRVAEPGVKCAPAGITLRDLIEGHCGGMAAGHRLKAFLPGGASGGLLTAGEADLPLDFGTLEPMGGFIGSAAVVVLSDKDDLASLVTGLMAFFADESCGQCTPCRLGTEKAALLMENGAWDEALLRDLARIMAEASICGLGQAAGNPLLSLLDRFPGEVPR
ncbi:MAG: NADH-ubiquinone oxidoreductase-F iron-sulfur binding region domain-containing protein, partial [Rhodospirillales bacterium]